MFKIYKMYNSIVNKKTYTWAMGRYKLKYLHFTINTKRRKNDVLIPSIQV